MFYEFVTQSACPVTLATFKTYVKYGSATSEDAIMQLMLDEATECGEKYTGRSFRAQTFNVYLDYFYDDHIEIRLSPIDTIDQISYINELGVLTVVDPATYYLKKGQWWSEVVLMVNENWPSDVKEIEHAIKITVSTVKYVKANSSIDMGILKHAAYLHANRGDCSCDNRSMKDSGAKNCYDKFRIQRV